MKKLFFLRKLTLSIKRFFSKKIILFGELEIVITQLLFFAVGVLAGIYFILSGAISEIPSSPWINLVFFFGVLFYGLISISLFKEKERRKEVDFNSKLVLEILGYYLGGFLGLMLGLVILLLLVLGALIVLIFVLIYPLGLFFWNWISKIFFSIPFEFWITFGLIIIPLVLFWILSGRKIKKDKEDKDARIFVEKTKKRLKEERIFDSLSEELKDSF